MELVKNDIQAICQFRITTSTLCIKWPGTDHTKKGCKLKSDSQEQHRFGIMAYIQTDSSGSVLGWGEAASDWEQSLMSTITRGS